MLDESLNLETQQINYCTTVGKGQNTFPTLYKFPTTLKPTMANEKPNFQLLGNIYEDCKQVELNK